MTPGRILTNIVVSILFILHFKEIWFLVEANGIFCPWAKVSSKSSTNVFKYILFSDFGGNKYLISDNKAFLFSLNYNEKYPSLNRGNNYVDRNDMGPIFGYYCIYINDKFFSSKGNYYNPNRVRYDFGDRSQDKSTFFQVVDLEIYQIFEL